MRVRILLTSVCDRFMNLYIITKLVLRLIQIIISFYQYQKLKKQKYGAYEQQSRLIHFIFK